MARSLAWNRRISLILVFTAACASVFGCTTETGLSEEQAGSPSESTATDVVPGSEKSTAVSTSGSQGMDSLVPQTRAREWTYLVIHHTATEAGDVESIHRAHLERRDAAGIPWQGIGYHFLIGNGKGMDDGAIEPTFRWREQLAGAHAGVGTYNDLGIGICLVGNFETNPPSPRQVSSLKRLVEYLSERYDIAAENILRHGDIKETACPGKLFPMEEVVPTVAHGAPVEQRLSRLDR